MHNPWPLIEPLIVVGECGLSVRGGSLLECAHGGNLVQGVAQVGKVLAHEPVFVVAEDTGDAVGDIEEVAFEGEDDNGVCAEKRKYMLVRGGEWGKAHTSGKPDQCLAEILAIAGFVVHLASLVRINSSEHSHHVLGDEPGEQTGGNGGGIVYDISPVIDRIHDRLGLGSQVDLEANMIAGLGARAKAEGDDGEAVDEGLAGFAVVEERDLALPVLC